MLLLAAALGGFFIGEYVGKQILHEPTTQPFRLLGKLKMKLKHLILICGALLLAGCQTNVRFLCAG